MPFLSLFNENGRVFFFLIGSWPSLWRMKRFIATFCLRLNVHITSIGKVFMTQTLDMAKH